MLALVLALACTVKDTADDSATDDSAASGLRTLNNCGTDIGGDVPDFFSWFRCAEISMDGGTILAHTLALPPHPSPYYEDSDPNWVEWDDQGNTRFQNPNRIAEQDLNILIPSDPVSRGLNITNALVDRQAGTSEDEYREPGISPDGIPLFSGIAAPGDDIAQEAETFDIWEAHPQMNGVYHHHSANPAALAVAVEAGLTDTTTPGQGDIEIYGIMCDGTVVLGCKEADGSTVSDGDLDGQSGHVHDIVGPEGQTWFSDRYHTHVCTGVYEDFTPEIQYYEGCERG